MQVDNAAPMPVPVQMRMPRLNMADAWPTPADFNIVCQLNAACRYWDGERTELELSGPHRPGRIGHEVLGEVALDTADHVVTAGLAALADDTEGVVLHNGRAADTAEKPLLHSALELEDGNLWRRL